MNIFFLSLFYFYSYSLHSKQFHLCAFTAAFLLWHSIQLEKLIRFNSEHLILRLQTIFKLDGKPDTH